MKFWRKPLDHDKFSTPKGEIHIIEDRCKGCGFCIEFCPNDVFIESEKFNVKGYHPPEPKDPESCIACKLCELICPEFSIFIVGSEDLDATEDESTPKPKKNKTEVA
jgi:2-oxoglutarate ferredoxin oxidoreductase subunit delta